MHDRKFAAGSTWSFHLATAASVCWWEKTCLQIFGLANLSWFNISIKSNTEFDFSKVT